MKIKKYCLGSGSLHTDTNPTPKLNFDPGRELSIIQKPDIIRPDIA